MDVVEYEVPSSSDEDAMSSASSGTDVSFVKQDARMTDYLDSKSEDIVGLFLS